MQLASSPTMRGRVLALWIIAWAGSTPIGGPIVGWIGQVAGPRYSLLVGGLPTIAVGLIAFPLLSAIDAKRSHALAVTAAATPSDTAAATEV